MDGENDEGVSGDVSEDAFYDGEGRAQENLKHANQTQNSKSGTGEKHPEVFAQIVVHDAEIGVGRLNEGIKDEGDNGKDGEENLFVKCDCCCIAGI